MKTAIVMSDPKAGEEALDRVFNALAVAHEGLHAGDEVDGIFNGTGTRWPEELTKSAPPASGLCHAVRETVKGVSQGWSVVFGAEKRVEACVLPLLTDTALAGTLGLPIFVGLSRMAGPHSCFEPFPLRAWLENSSRSRSPDSALRASAENLPTEEMSS
jgi:hypothetical protein